MLYFTPFEMSEDDKLKSSLLEHFEFSTQDNVATWMVRKGLKYDNGNSVTPEDVAFAVTRMAYVRPLFPVIREIVGIQDWLKSKDALSTYPKGITVDGQKISIRLSSPVDHPLFRFVLELFSVIPKSCVDLKTNKLVCARPPASGYYRMKSESKDEITFEARSDFPAGVEIPRQKFVRFLYRKPASIVGPNPPWPKKTVIAGNESAFSDDELTQLQKLFHLRALPKNRFAALQINPNAKAFVAQECRLAFLQRFRDKLVELGVPKRDVEASLTMAILPGYLDWEELLRRGTPILAQAFEKCAAELKRNPVEFTVWEGQRFPLAEKAVVATLASFGQTVASPTVKASRADVVDKFVKAESPLMLVGSGFWPQDPFGDLQMLFTPNLHKMLQFIAKDDELQGMIARLRAPLPPKEKRNLAEKLNVHVFNQGLLGVYRHTKRFYLSPKEQGLASVPLALTSPSPWQVFEN